MTLEARIDHHRRMAMGYANAYLHQEVQEGQEYDDWTFAADAIYTSPYFTGEEVLLLSEVPTEAAEAATMEARAYALTFPDWKPVSFEYWAAEHGLTMKVRWQGTRSDGTTMGFYSYSFVTTNEAGEVAKWETHVNDEYSTFLDAAIGVHGPFHGHSEYVDALRRRLAESEAADG